MYYVSYIEEFPIYEPAEGGYYYPGESVIDLRACQTWRKAKQTFNKWRKWFEEEYGPASDPDIYHRQAGGVDRQGDGPFICWHGKYIGDGAKVQITRYEPKDKGWEPYC